MPNISQIVSTLKAGLASLLPGSQQSVANTDAQEINVSRFLVYLKHPVQFTRIISVNATDVAHAQALAAGHVVGDWTVDRIIAQ